MRLPPAMLERMRGPLVAVALSGCSHPAPAISPEPLAVPAVPAPAPVAVVPLDPVAYDDAAEASRLAREEETTSVDGTRRARRLALALREERAAEVGLGLGLHRGGSIGHGWYGAGCGRG